MKLIRKHKQSVPDRRQAFLELYDTYGSRIYGFAMRLSGGDTWMSEEILQTVFMRLWEHWDNMNDHNAALSYMFSTAKNLFLNYCEHKTVRYIYEEYMLQRHEEATTESIERQDAISLESYLKQIVDNMPPMRQQVFVMSRYRHMTNKQIAADLHISEKTVEVHITLALKELRAKLKTEL